MRLEGKVKVLLPIQSGVSKAGKEWAKRDIVITQDPDSKYPKDACVTFFGADKVGSLEQYDAGTNVVVDFNVESREWEGRYFTNINGYFIDHNSDKQIEKTTASGTPLSAFDSSSPDEEDDLPF